MRELLYLTSILLDIMSTFYYLKYGEQAFVQKDLHLHIFAPDIRNSSLIIFVTGGFEFSLLGRNGFKGSHFRIRQ